MRKLSLLLALLAAPAGAGLIDSLSPAELQLAYCRQAAQDAGEDAGRVLGVWQACLDEARKRGYDEVLPEIRGELALARAAYRASTIPGIGRAERLERALQVVAEESDAEFSLDGLLRFYRDYLLTDQGRSRMQRYRSLTFRWTNRSRLDPDTIERVDAALRLYAEKAGFRWVDAGTERAAEADLLVVGSARQVDEVVGADQPVARHRVTTTLGVESVRFRRVGLDHRGFTKEVSVVDAQAEDARRESAHRAAERLVAELLRESLVLALKDVVYREDLELDPVEDFDFED